MKILVSACLLGAPCRYDGRSVPDERVIRLMDRHVLIPVCPERLGGLDTPRTPSERRGYKVISADGEDRTAAFVKGAKLCREKALEAGCELAILKSKSPSCGCGNIYDGSFSGTLVKSDGITAEYLKKWGMKVLNENDPEVEKL